MAGLLKVGTVKVGTGTFSLSRGVEEKIGDCHKRQPEISSNQHGIASAVDCPPIFSQLSVPIFGARAVR
jgi:hypothetical protein